MQDAIMRLDLFSGERLESTLPRAGEEPVSAVQGAQGSVNVDAVLREHLEVVYADSEGRKVPKADGARAYAVIGPVPLPVEVATGESVVMSWMTFAPLRGETLEMLGKSEGAPTMNKAFLQSLSRQHQWPHCVLSFGDLHEGTPLVRIHSTCATGDIFKSQRCECGPQLHAALDEIVRAGQGAVVYLANHEGRGIGLFAKAVAYLLQDEGVDTYDANTLLGFNHDDRDFVDAAFILHHLLGPRKTVRLLSNNPEKAAALEGRGVEVERLVPLIRGVHKKNVRYLRSKAKFGHILPERLL
jgi:GTP cyclohydrolase II